MFSQSTLSSMAFIKGSIRDTHTQGICIHDALQMSKPMHELFHVHGPPRLTIEEL